MVSLHPSLYFFLQFLFQGRSPVRLQLWEHGHSGLCHTPHTTTWMIFMALKRPQLRDRLSAASSGSINFAGVRRKNRRSRHQPQKNTYWEYIWTSQQTRHVSVPRTHADPSSATCRTSTSTRARSQTRRLDRWRVRLRSLIRHVWGASVGRRVSPLSHGSTLLTLAAV